MKHLAIIIVLCTALISCSNGKDVVDQPNQAVTFTYPATSTIFPNPERGFMHTWIVYSSNPIPVSVNTLNFLKQENISLVLRVYYLEKFKNSPLDQTELDLIQTDLTRIRDAGVKCIVRFAYTDIPAGSSTGDPTDAPFSVISQHLDQLKPIITANADVIAFVQAGFIGTWGEWHSSTNGLSTVANQTLVMNKLLSVFPKEVKIQVRTPLYKQGIFNTSTAIDASIGYGTTDIARVGFHNDCFLSSPDDYGTYQNIPVEKKYISDEANYVPTGGETCPPAATNSTSCNAAEAEMSFLKWTYINVDYYGPVLQAWRDNSCFDIFQRNLGYRLALQTSILKPEATVGGIFDIDLTMNNVGYAPVYHQKNIFLIFKAADNTIYKKQLTFDIRKAIPQVSTKIQESVNLSGIPAGTYDLSLRIEDIAPGLSTRSEYCIRLANLGIWDQLTGYNKLSHTLTIK